MGDSFRAVFKNDPAPAVPFEDVLTFFHAGTEVHFYDCAPMAYIAYPFNADDTPISDLLAGADHSGYWCLNGTPEPVPTQFLQ